jgi:hypothetical protein
MMPSTRSVWVLNMKLTLAGSTSPLFPSTNHRTAADDGGSGDDDDDDDGVENRATAASAHTADMFSCGCSGRESKDKKRISGWRERWVWWIEWPLVERDAKA